MIFRREARHFRAICSLSLSSLTSARSVLPAHNENDANTALSAAHRRSTDFTIRRMSAQPLSKCGDDFGDKKRNLFMAAAARQGFMPQEYEDAILGLPNTWQLRVSQDAQHICATPPDICGPYEPRLITIYTHTPEFSASIPCCRSRVTSSQILRYGHAN